MEDIVINTIKHKYELATAKSILKKIIAPINTNKSYRELIKSKNFSRISLPDENKYQAQETRSNNSFNHDTKVDIEMDKKAVNIIKRNLISRFKRSPYIKY